MDSRSKSELKISRLKAPFPYFGGKRRVAHIVWPRFGNVPNYVEPFFGSGAILLARPPEWPARNETVNDLDCFIANFWRAVKRDPAKVAHYADWPINEADLHARHKWLHSRRRFVERMHSEPHYFDAKIAGWWVWGISCWIGEGWCRPKLQGSPAIARHSRPVIGAGERGVTSRQFPNLVNTGEGVHKPSLKRPLLLKGGAGVHRERPVIKKGGCGVHRKMPNCGGRGNKGCHGSLPDIGGNDGSRGRGINAKYVHLLRAYMEALAKRLRNVRVCCGDWSRILGPTPTTLIGATAVFLDPPYGAEGRDEVYSHDSKSVAADVRKWCQKHGDDRKLRIALCGYAGEHDELEGLGWSVVAWKAKGGYGARNKANKNAERERIWFSPHCLKEEMPLFEMLDKGK